MKTELIRQLKGDEGVVSHAYPDHLGYLTIGVGRLIDKRKGGGLRPDEISYLLNNDVDDRINELLGFANTLKLVEQGKYENAAHAMLQSKWAQQTPERAKRMADQMRSGVWQYAP
jgi:lysozyme